MEDGYEQQRHRTVHIEEFGDLAALQDLLRAPQIGGDDHRPVVALEYGLAVRDRNGVVVDVRDSGLGVGRLGDFVDIAEGRYTGTYVQELSDALTHRMTHGPAHKGAIGLHDLGKSRHELHGLAGRFPVHLEIVRSAQIEVIHA